MIGISTIGLINTEGLMSVSFSETYPDSDTPAADSGPGWT